MCYMLFPLLTQFKFRRPRMYYLLAATVTLSLIRLRTAFPSTSTCGSLTTETTFPAGAEAEHGIRILMFFWLLLLECFCWLCCHRQSLQGVGVKNPLRLLPLSLRCPSRCATCCLLYLHKHTSPPTHVFSIYWKQENIVV